MPTWKSIQPDTSLPTDAQRGPLGPRALRIRLEAHNRRVLLMTAFTCLSTAAFWIVGYAVFYWLTLLVVTVARGTAAQAPAHHQMLLVYSGIGLILVGIAGVEKWLSPDERARDKRPFYHHFFDLIFAAPRATLAIFGNLTAWRRLSAEDLRFAAAFLERIATEGRIPLQNVPQEIPDEQMRERVLLTLQLLGILESRRDDRDAWLTLNSKLASRLKKLR